MSNARAVTIKREPVMGYIIADDGKAILKVVYPDGLTSYSPAMMVRSYKAYQYWMRHP